MDTRLINRFISVCLLIIILYPIPLKGSTGTGKRPTAEIGLIDLRNWDFAREGSINLRGDWNFYYGRFIDPSVFPDNIPTADGLVTVPGVWDNFRYDGRDIGSAGFGTYHLRILLPDMTGSLALRFNTISTAASVFVNGMAIGQAGEPGTTREDMKPDYFPMILDLPYDQQFLDLVIHVSNFYHTQGGIWTDIQIGLEQDVRQDYNFDLVLNLFVVGSLIILGLYHMGMYSLRKYTKSPFYFGLLSLLLGIRTLITGDIHLHHFFRQFPWELLIRIEYLTVYMGIPLFVKFQQTVFPEDFPRRLTKIVFAVGTIFSLAVLLTAVWFFTNTLIPFFLLGIPAVLICIVYAFISVRNRRVGSRIFLSASLILFITFLNDVLFSLELIFTGFFTSYGILLFVAIQAFLLSFRFSESFQTIKRQDKELRNHQDNLEQLIKERTSALEKANKRLKALTMIDGLTRIANRRRFDEYLEVEWSRMRREKKPLAIIISDIDYFKKFNDNYGHQAGDECLKKVAATIQKSISRPGDLVARYGGEEFCAILPDTTLEGAERIGEKMRQNVESLEILHEHSKAGKFVTISSGVICQIPDPDSSYKALVEKADQNLYTAKKKGRNRICADTSPVTEN